MTASSQASRVRNKLQRIMSLSFLKCVTWISRGPSPLNKEMFKLPKPTQCLRLASKSWSKPWLYMSFWLWWDRNVQFSKHFDFFIKNTHRAGIESKKSNFSKILHFPNLVENPSGSSYLAQQLQIWQQFQTIQSILSCTRYWKWKRCRQVKNANLANLYYYSKPLNYQWCNISDQTGTLHVILVVVR